MDTTELQNQAIEIRDAENEGENTATKVGTLLVNIIQALEGTVTEESLTETLKAIEEVLQRDYASLENSTVKWHQRGVIMLKSMGSALDNIDGGSYTPTLEIGDTWFSPTSGGLVHKTQDGNEAWFVRPDAVYINSHTLRVYKWASGSMVELGSGRNPVMIDYMVSKTLDSIAVGEVFWQSSNSKLVVKTGESSVRMFSPDPSVIYCARDTKSLMFWDTATSTWQSVGGGNAGQITNINDGQNYRIWVGTQEDLDALNGVFEDDVIYLVGTVPQAVTRYSVNTNGLTHCTVPAGTPTKVTENGSFSVVVSPESGYTIDSCYATMGSSTINGVPLTGANAGKYQITINAVTANIVIKASASVHLKSITVTQGTRTGNAIQMNAALNPANAENVTLQWSVIGSQYVTINQSTGLLTILEGASNVSETVTCADANSGVSGTLQLTGLSYDDSVPLVSLGAVSYTAGAAANTYQFSVEKNPAGANTHSIRWEIDSVSPRGAATIDAGTGLLTITNDCEVVVSAKAYQGMAQDTNINTVQSDIVTLTYQLSGPIQFEDWKAKGLALYMTGKIADDATQSAIEADTQITYENVASLKSLPGREVPDIYITGERSIEYFNEAEYFKSWHLNPSNWPKLREFAYDGDSEDFKDIGAAGELCTGNPKLVKLKLPNNLNSLVGTASGGPINTLAAIQVLDLSNTQLVNLTTGQRLFNSCSKLKTIIMPSTLQNFTIVQVARYVSTLQYVVFTGKDMVDLSFVPYTVSSINLVFTSTVVPVGITAIPAKTDLIYVPDASFDLYKGKSPFSTKYSSGKLKKISELPANWNKTVYSVTTSNATNSNDTSAVEYKSSYQATLSSDGSSGSLTNVKVTMDGEDITSTVYDVSTHTINITKVLGDIVIDGNYVEPETTE